MNYYNLGFLQYEDDFAPKRFLKISKVHIYFNGLNEDFNILNIRGHQCAIQSLLMIQTCWLHLTNPDHHLSTLRMTTLTPLLKIRSSEEASEIR